MSNYTLLKQRVIHFSGDTGKTTVLKVLEIYQKNIFSSVHFKKLELSIHLPLTIPKTDSTANVSFVYSDHFKIAARASVVKSLFSKVTETPAFCNSVEKLARAWHVPKSSSSRNFEKPPFNRSSPLLNFPQTASIIKDLLVKPPFFQ